MAVFLISSSSNDAPLRVKRYTDFEDAEEAGDGYGYVPVHGTVDPYLMVDDSGKLGQMLDRLLGKNKELWLEPEKYQGAAGLKEALLEAAEDPGAKGNSPDVVPGFSDLYTEDELED